MKKTLGCGFKLPSESWEYAFGMYKTAGFNKSKKEVLNDIKIGKKDKILSKNCKPGIFKVVIELIGE